jgi:hypothetical protein
MLTAHSGHIVATAQKLITDKMLFLTDKYLNRTNFKKIYIIVLSKNIRMQLLRAKMKTIGDGRSQNNYKIFTTPHNTKLILALVIYPWKDFQ